VQVDVDDRVLLKLSFSGMITRSYEEYELFAPALPKKPPRNSQSCRFLVDRA
jgi:hypothetical protein